MNTYIASIWVVINKLSSLPATGIYKTCNDYKVAALPAFTCNHWINKYRALQIMYERNERNLPSWEKSISGKQFFFRSQNSLHTPQCKPSFHLLLGAMQEMGPHTLGENLQTILTVNGECKNESCPLCKEVLILLLTFSRQWLCIIW